MIFFKKMNVLRFGIVGLFYDYCRSTTKHFFSVTLLVILTATQLSLKADRYNEKGQGWEASQSLCD